MSLSILFPFRWLLNRKAEINILLALRWP